LNQALFKELNCTKIYHTTFVTFFLKHDTGSHLKNRILVQDRGGAEFQTGGILLYVEDLKRGTNKDIGPKDLFEMASNQWQGLASNVHMQSLLALIPQR